MNNSVSIISDKNFEYPIQSPFSPSENYPEYSFNHLMKEKNQVYDNIRKLLYQLNLDIKNWGKPEWNPLGDFIKPGAKVLIKPNWVRDFNPINEDISGLLTHSSILRAIMDYCLIALKNSGELIIGDAPIQTTNFKILKDKLNVDEVIHFYRGKTGTIIQIKDFRREIKEYDKKGGIVRQLWNEKSDAVEIDLKDRSFLYPIQHQYKKFRVTNYDPVKMRKYHNKGTNIFVVDNDILTADVIIQLPKLKTHRKAGITCCLKNSIGINCQKDALVHHRKGSIIQGGDAYPYFNFLKWMNENLYEYREQTKNRRLQHFYSKIIGINSGLMKRLKCNRFFEGSWYGNDTLWRTILDLTNILFTYDKNGKPGMMQERILFYIVDAIIGGDSEGPLEPDNKFAGFLAGGWNPVLVDTVCSKMVGFDYKKMPTFRKALENKVLGFDEHDLINSSIIFNTQKMHFAEVPVVINYNPSRGWKNHIEIEKKELL